MRLKKLTITNLASIEKAEIDFCGGPLGSAEVFLITGDTGSGKSTILDAICLALYATTPRMANNRMQGDTDDPEDARTSLKDPRQILRRNKAEGSAILAFTGSDGIDYEACWAVRRARGKADGRLQGRTWTLMNLSTGEQLRKDRDIQAAIHNAIKLDFKQFRRTTMLAQGEFTRFLNSPDNEKAEILEKITGADIYSRISEKIFEITAGKKAAADEAQRKCDGFRPLTQDEIAERNASVADIRQQTAAMEQRIADMEKCLRWVSEESALQKRLNDCEEASRAAVAGMESDEFKEKIATIRQFDASAEPRAAFVRMQEAETARVRNLAAIENMRGRYCRLLAGRLWMEQRLGTIAAEIEKLKDFIDSQKDYVDIFSNAQTIAGKLDRLAEATDKIADYCAEKERAEKEMAEKLRPAFACAENSCKSLEAEIRNNDDLVSALRRQPELCGLKDRRAEKERLTDTTGPINLALERMDVLENAEKSAGARENAISECRSSIDSIQEQLPAIGKELTETAALLVSAEKSLEQQKDSAHKFARQMRSRLEPGCRCPVCRQIVSDIMPSEGEIESIYADALKLRDERKALHDSIADRRNSLEAALRLQTAELKRLMAEAETDRSVETARTALTAALGLCGMNVSCSHQELLELKKRTEEKIATLSARIREAEKTEERITALTSANEKMRRNLDKATALANQARAAMESANTLIAGAVRMTGEKKAERDAAVRDIRSLCGEMFSEADLAAPNAGLGRNLCDRAARYEKAVGTLSDKKNESGKLQTEIAGLDTVISEIKVTVGSWQDLTADAAEPGTSARTDAMALLSNVGKAIALVRDAEETVRKTKAAVQRCVGADKDIDIRRLEYLSSLPADTIAGLRKDIREAGENVKARQSLMDEAGKALATHRDSRPDTDGLTDPEQIASEITALKESAKELLHRQISIVKELEDDRRCNEAYRQQLEEVNRLNDEHLRWERLNGMFGERSGNKFRKIAQSYILSSLIDSANTYMRRLTDRYRLKVTPGTFVISLIDAYQGFTSRSAATISGGESFLVSLALALALSDIDSRLAADTIFIDEGFGTLSGEPLQNAVATLRSLHSGSGRKVGIISHIAELREKIPVQIHVSRSGSDSAAKIEIKTNN